MLKLQTYLKSHHTSIKQEMLAGLTTFFTMAYIAVLAPKMYASCGMPFNAAFIATCLMACTATLIVGVFANVPIALAPGLGLLSYFVYAIVGEGGYTWQVGLGAVFISALIFFVITVSSIRQHIIASIPESLGLAISAGIGFFIGFIALQNVGVLARGQSLLITLSHLGHIQTTLFLLGFLIIVALEALNIKGAMLISILSITLLGVLFGVGDFHGVFAVPHFDMNMVGAMQIKPLLSWHAFPLLFTFVIVAVFSSVGTLLGLTRLMHFKHEREAKEVVNRVLFVEGFATLSSALVGITTLSPYIESAAGIKDGGKTWLTAVTISLCFLLLLFFAPIAANIPSFATAGVLLYVACLMVKAFAEVEWRKPTELIPAIITFVTIPLSFSIADGTGAGILAYVILKSATGKTKEVHPMMWVLAFIFVIYFAFIVPHKM